MGVTRAAAATSGWTGSVSSIEREIGEVGEPRPQHHLAVDRFDQRIAERVHDRAGDEHGRHVDDRQRAGDRPAEQDPGAIDDRVGRPPQRPVHLAFEIGGRCHHREASGATAPTGRASRIDHRVGDRTAVALGTAQSPAGDDARRLDRGVDDQRQRSCRSAGRRRASAHPPRGRQLPNRARPAGR